MAATTTTQRILLLRRSTHLTPHHSYLLHHFSSTAEPDSKPPTEPASESQSQSQSEVKSSLSFIREVKSSLRREPRPNPSFTPRKPSGSSIGEITRNLSEFRRLTAPPPPPNSAGEDFVSAQELYNRNVLSPPRDSPPSSKPSLDSIRDSLKNLRKSAEKSRNEPRPIDRVYLDQFRESLKQKVPDQNLGVGYGPIFGGEGGSDIGGDQKAKTLGFLRIYNYDELGQKLRALRPGKTKGKWFTFGELKDRLEKLRDIEEKESQDRLKMGPTFLELRNSLAIMGFQEEEKKKKRILQPLNVMGLGHLGGVPSFMLSPPKDELVEKYFHPDNMSAAEKLNLELKKVRDEFKMSESDCGSARVQVAQLTTKIKHLSSALHKKDKHSRHGLQAMVQRRKKLLKYLRRTDWDSYCLVLSKLGLRDNAEIKA